MATSEKKASRNRLKWVAISGLALLVFTASVAWVLQVVIPAVEGAADAIETTVDEANAKLAKAQEEAKRRAALLQAEPAEARPYPHVLALPAVPLTGDKPLVERPGVDRFGQPRSYVDKVQLLARLDARDFAYLTDFVEWAQKQAERDITRERWIEDAIIAFGAANESLEPLFDAWVEAHPESFAPYLARAQYRLVMGAFYRGTRLANETSEKKFDAMRREARLAHEDLERAQALHPKLCMVHTLALREARMTSNDRLQERTLKDGHLHCPTSYAFASSEQKALTPRWGGSMQAMKLAAKKAVARGPDNERLSVLAQFANADRAQMALVKDEPERTLEILRKALASAPIAPLYNHQARAYHTLKRYEDALSAANRALEDAPLNADALRNKANALHELDRHEEAIEAIITAKRLEPLERNEKGYLVILMRPLISAGHRLFGRKKYEEAIAVYAEALEKYPWFLEARLWKSIAESYAIGPVHAEEAIVALIDEYPHYYEAHYHLARHLAAAKKYAPMVPRWKQYLSHYPNHAEARFRLGDALYRTGKMKDAQQEFHTACALEHAEACKAAKYLYEKHRAKTSPQK